MIYLCYPKKKKKMIYPIKTIIIFFKKNQFLYYNNMFLFKHVCLDILKKLEGKR